MNIKLQSLNKDQLLTIISKLSKKELINVINQKMVIEQMGGNNIQVSSKNATRNYIIATNNSIKKAENNYKQNKNNTMRNDNFYNNINENENENKK